jgi:hypothetical protein
MTRRSKSPQKPHTRAKATREKALHEDTSDDRWAATIRKSLLDGCHPYQLDAVTDPAKRYSFLVGRGGTKTTCFRVRGVLKTTSMQRAKVLYFASTRQRAKDLMWFPLKALLHKLGVDATFNETELRCTVTQTGSMYMISGLQDVADADKWRGDTFDEVQFDECGAIKPELLEYTVYQVIGPRVHCLGLGGTPGLSRRKIFYEATRPGSDKHRPYKDRHKSEYANFKGYSSHHWTLKDIVDLPSAKKKYPALVELHEEQLEENERNKWSDDNPIKRREQDAVWSADGTLRVFNAFRARLDDGTPWNVWNPFDGGELVEGVSGLKLAIAALKKLHRFTDWRYVLIEDMGHKDPYACTVFAFSPHDAERNIWQVMSFEKVGMHAKPIAELLLGADELDVYIKTGVFPTKYGGVFGVVGWPDALEMDADHATIEELKNVYGIATAKADKKPEYKNGAIELVNGGFNDGRIKVILNSPLHEQCEQLQWKELDNGRLVEDPAQANHSSDTLVYGRRRIAAMFESGQVAQDEKPGAATPTEYRDPMGLPPGIGTEDQPDETEGLLSPSEWHDDDDDW